MYSNESTTANAFVVELFNDPQAAQTAHAEIERIDAELARLHNRRQQISSALEQLYWTTDVVDGVALSVDILGSNPSAPVKVSEVTLSPNGRIATAYQHARTNRWLVAVDAPDLPAGGVVLDTDYATAADAVTVAKAFVATGTHTN